jgi:MYXO-CTERM domain-containing protein
MKTSMTCLFGGTLLMAGQAALANGVIDQLNATVETYMVGSYTQGFLSQTFKQTAGSICGAGVYVLNFFGNTDYISLTVFDADPYFGGSPIAGATGVAIANSAGWVDAYWSPVAITPGQEYFLQISGLGLTGLAGSVSETYANGSLRYFGTDYGAFGYDMTFRTWAPIPTPGAATLLGLAGLAASRRRR